MSTFDKLAKKYDGATYGVHTDGNYTIVEMKYKGNRVFGIAKRNPSCDPLVYERGRDIAVGRALRNMDKALKKLNGFVSADSGVELVAQRTFSRGELAG